jgi:hypothetical protein
MDVRTFLTVLAPFLAVLFFALMKSKKTKPEERVAAIPKTLPLQTSPSSPPSLTSQVVLEEPSSLALGVAEPKGSKKRSAKELIIAQVILNRPSNF